MNKYVPNEVKDLSSSKERVMRNVINGLENQTKKSKFGWRYGLMTAFCAVTAVFFVLIQFSGSKEQAGSVLNGGPTIFTEEQGEYYLYGVTLGNSKSEVIEKLGENYIDVFYLDGSGADSILEYNNVEVHLVKDEVFMISIPRMNESDYEKMFNEYDGEKFVDWQDKYDRYSLSYARFFYSEEAAHILMAKYDPARNLRVSLSYKDINFEETLKSPFLEPKFVHKDKIIKEESFGQKDTDIEKDLNTLLSGKEFFQSNLADTLNGVYIDEKGTVVVDFKHFGHIIGTLSHSERGELQKALNEVIFKHPQTKEIYYTFEGNFTAFGDWTEVGEHVYKKTD